MRVSVHAMDRMRQRAIPAAIVDVIYAYGEPYRSAGALGLSLNRVAIEMAGDDLPSETARSLGRYRGAYIVVAEGEVVITVARSTRRRRS